MGDKVLVGVVGRGDGDGDDGGADGGGALGEVVEPSGRRGAAVVAVVALHGADDAAAVADDPAALTAGVAAGTVAGTVGDDARDDGGEDEEGEEVLEGGIKGVGGGQDLDG